MLMPTNFFLLIFPMFSQCKRALFSRTQSSVLEDVVPSTHGEMDMAREEEKRTGAGFALVTPDSFFRGNAGDQNVGRWERGDRGRAG